MQVSGQSLSTRRLNLDGMRWRARGVDDHSSQLMHGIIGIMQELRPEAVPRCPAVAVACPRLSIGGAMQSAYHVPMHEASKLP